MRGVTLAASICLSAHLVCAQEQEKKLLDRLLKPDMSLENEAQGKRFTTSGANINKKATTKSFSLPPGKTEKGFWNTRQVASREFPTGASRYAHAEANVTPRFKLDKVDESYTTGGYRDVYPAKDAHKTVQGSDYPGIRAFIASGKSQKALSAQDRPLTIDQVRELLNKNK